MKKLFVLILAFSLLCLCGCVKNANNDETATSKTTETTTASTASTTIHPQRIEHIAKKLEQGMIESFDGYSDEEKEQIKKAVEDDGYTLEYKSDGSAVLSNEEGEWTVAKGWVENEFTKGVPSVDFGMVTMSFSDVNSDGNEYYMFLIRQASYSQAKNYVEKLKAAGFTKVQSEANNEEGNIIVFEAYNADGKFIAVGFSSNGFTVQITK